MSSKAFHGAGVIVAAMLATLLAAALPAPTAAPQRASLVGQLLVASPSMGDPRFYQTVIVLVWHENRGAMGIVVNRPLKERPVAALLEALGEKADGAAGNVRLFAGGPVEPDRGFVVRSAEYRRADTMAIDAQLAMTASRECATSPCTEARNRAWWHSATRDGDPGSSRARSRSASGSPHQRTPRSSSRRTGSGCGRTR